MIFNVKYLFLFYIMFIIKIFKQNDIFPSKNQKYVLTEIFNFSQIFNNNIFN